MISVNFDPITDFTVVSVPLTVVAESGAHGATAVLFVFIVVADVVADVRCTSSTMTFAS